MIFNDLFSKKNGKKNKPLADLIIILASSIFIFIISVHFDLFELIITTIKKYEVWETDELFIVFLFLVISLSIYSFRRWRESIHELGNRKQMEYEIRQINEKLESRIKERTAEIEITNQALRESETEYRELTDLLPQSVFEIDLIGNIHYVNRYGLESTGYSRQDVEKGINVFSLFPEEEHIRLKENMAKIIQKLDISPNEYTFIKKDHSLIPIMIYSSVIIRDNQPVGFRGVFIEITKLKEAEQRIKQEKEKFFHLLEIIPAFVYIQRPDYTIPYANRNFREIFGDPESKLCYQVLQKRQSPCENCVTFHIFETKEPLYLERKNPNGRYFMLYDYYISDFEGSPAIMEFGIDITERRKTEEALKESEERFRLLVDNINEALFIVDTKGIINYITPGVKTIIGQKPPDIIGRRLTEYVYQQDLSLIIDLYKKAIAGEEITREFRVVNIDQEAIWIRCSVKPQYQDSVIIGIQGILVNIKAQKLIEENLKQAKDSAEAANRSKSEFLANMSHELRTPLNSILGFSQILLYRDINLLTEKQLKYLNFIKDSGSHLLEMVNDILDLAKVEAGKLKINKKPFDIYLMLSRSPSTIQALAAKKNIEMVINIDSKIGWLDGDEVRIKQVIYNLLSNAIKFTKSGKKIGMEAQPDGRNVILTIWDEGIGISEEFKDKIFEPFEQISNGFTSKIDGTGLGLPISKKIIELHYGSLNVVSKLNQGSRFSITLPGRMDIKNDHEESKNVQSAVEQSVNNDKLILVVEDDEINKDVISELLLTYGYRIDFAFTGEKALELVSEKNYDLILMDIQLPGMSGIDAMKEIRKIYSYQIPIIAITAFAMKGDREKYLKEGFDDYISKPLDFNFFKEKILSILN